MQPKTFTVTEGTNANHGTVVGRTIVNDVNFDIQDSIISKLGAIITWSTIINDIGFDFNRCHIAEGDTIVKRREIIQGGDTVVKNDTIQTAEKYKIRAEKVRSTCWTKSFNESSRLSSHFCF